MSSISSPASAQSTSSALPLPSATSRTPNLGAIVGGAVGGVVALGWLLGLLYFAHRHNWFRRRGYTRHKEERGMFGKRSPAITPTTESGGPFLDNRPQPQTGIGARTFGEPRRAPQPPATARYSGVPPRTSFSEPRRTSYPETTRTSYGEPPRTSYPETTRSDYGDPPPLPRTSMGDRPRATFGPQPVPPPVPLPPQRQPQPQSQPQQQRSTFNDPPRGTNFSDRPRSGFGERPISGFGGDRERPRSGAFGDPNRRSMSPDWDRPRRGFFSSSTRADNEWEGAGRRIAEPGTLEMGEHGGLWGLLARARDHAAQKKRVRAEYEEDMKRMRVSSAVESDYGRY